MAAILHPPPDKQRSRRVPYEQGFSNLCLLCGYHHREFARRGWQVNLATDGYPEWTPPGWIDPERTPRRNRAHHRQLLTLPAPVPP